MSLAEPNASEAESGSFRTRGQPAATAAVRAMLASGVPHAILLTGPSGVGKTTLALDLAAALLCRAEPRLRPCRACRACRSLEHGNHPDLHRLAPAGAGAVIPIGGRDQRGVRDLIGELALLPVEGGARVAVVEDAERMTEDAQSALLKTLEEPPTGSILVLCAEDDERLLPTIRSRCVRIRLGPVPGRAIEEILVERGIADAPLAARVGRVSGGRPGRAILLAMAPDAVRLRAEIARSLIDLLDEPRALRLAGVRHLAARAAEMVRALGTAEQRGAVDPRAAARRRPSVPVGGGSAGAGIAGGAPSKATGTPSGGSGELPGPDAEEGQGTSAAAGARAAPAERRAAALALVEIWRDLVRDAALVGLSAPASAHDLDLVDDLESPAHRLTRGDAGASLRRLELAGERLEGNVSPELVLDSLALAWRRS